MSQISLRERPTVLTSIYGTLLGALPIIDNLGLCAHYFTPERAVHLGRKQQEAKLTGYIELFIEELTDDELLVLYEAIVIGKYRAQGSDKLSWIDK